MRFAPSDMIKNVSGKFGNQITNVMKGSSAGNIQTLKTYTKPYNPNTPNQQKIRKTFQYFSNLFFKGEDATVGGQFWDEGAWKENLQIKARERRYRGIATIGDNAGIQLSLGAAVKLKDDADVEAVVNANLLPQEMTSEAQMTQLLNVSTEILAYIDTMTQEDRLGYTN